MLGNALFMIAVAYLILSLHAIILHAKWGKSTMKKIMWDNVVADYIVLHAHNTIQFRIWHFLIIDWETCFETK